MSNDLELPDSPRAVIRTYSNYNRRGFDENSPNPPRRGDQHSNSLRVHAMSNSLKVNDESECIEMQRVVNESFSLNIQTER